MIKLRRHEKDTYTHLVIQLRELSETMHYAQSQETLLEIIDELIHRVAAIDNVVINKSEHHIEEELEDGKSDNHPKI